MKTASQIRQEFFSFFQSKGHTLVDSAPVVPENDPTLLFTNAGMNQFKDVFLGRGERPYKRAVDTQKCIRVSGKHNDLEVVGRDTYHHTFFEMLGNWSFGDYYKAEAIRWAWELLTNKWQLPKERLYATVYKTDEEALALWQEETDIDPGHILRFGDKDNFWEMGETGPCGPCSEIHFDLGEDVFERLGIPPVEGGVNSDSPRFIEIWNLVFIQYYRNEKGELEDLPQKHVDTGMGFERIVSVLQGQVSNYDTDLFAYIISGIASICGLDRQQQEQETEVALRVIADHVRALSFAIADGAMPGNEGRGYVLRRILRRAARYSRILGQDEPVLYRFVQLVVDTMADVFPELQQRRQHIETTIRAEEEQFNRTLDKGLQLFSQAAAELAKDGEKGIPGELVFKLYDTYGFPDDLTRVLAEEKGLDVDMEGYERAMQVQKDRARAAANFATRESDNLTWQVLQTGPGSDFTGYHHHREETRIQSYATSNGHVFLTLEKTPFYAESGGQVADTGRIEAASFALYVIDVQKDNERIIHRCEWQTGSQIVDEPVVAVIDESKRQLTAKNHTATHLMHAALRQVLGEHVQQAGSLVDAERLRFDFNHNQRVEAEEIRRIERLVNLEIRRNTALRIEDTSLREAREAGAMALFGEKYGDRVRTVAVPGFSLELCGGTHVASTGEIGIFKIVSETSIAAGVRRIEAITGPAVEDTMYQQQGVLFELQALLNSKADDIVSKVQALKQEKKQLEKQVSELKQTHFNSLAGTLLQQAKTVGKTPFVLHRDDSLDMEALRKLGENVYEQMNGSGVALIYAVNGGKMLLCCVVAAELVQNKMANAGNLVGAAAKIAGGGGGGKAHLATAGGRDVNQLEAVLAFFTEQVAAI